MKSNTSFKEIPVKTWSRSPGVRVCQRAVAAVVWRSLVLIDWLSRQIGLFGVNKGQLFPTPGPPASYQPPSYYSPLDQLVNHIWKDTVGENG